MKLYTVASFNHKMDGPNHIMVGNSPQEADLKIVNMVKPSDIVITQDLGLGALVLGRGGQVITPWGQVLKNEVINYVLEERAIKARYRRAGGRTKGPTKRSKENDLWFEKCLRRILEKNQPAF